MTLEYFKKLKLPETPGVYFFLNKQKKILYIGKATSLADRVRSYFAPDLITTRGALLVKMVEEAKKIEYKETSSVLEALLLEADLIKKFHPDFNTKEKDDKSFLCVALTSEDFPKVLLIRKKDLAERRNFRSSDLLAVARPDHKILPLGRTFGPFPNGGQIKEALKIIRKIFPYRDNKCILPESQKPKALSSPKPCFNYTIGLCPGTCVGKVSKKDYAHTIKNIEKFLSGDVASLTKGLTKDMNAYAKAKEFEKAKICRDKLYALEHINDIALIKRDKAEDTGESFRIESYDVAHMSGKDMVGVMTVVVNGEAEKSEYRKFKIRTVSVSNDPKALREILERRLEHTEWPYPNLIVVDGGVAQINVAHDVVLASGLSIPIVSVVKDERHRPKGFFGNHGLAQKYKREIILANNESHRFAIGYHKKMRGKRFLG